jgi:hypothetical protein
MIRISFYMMFEELLYREIGCYIGRVACETCSAMWNLGTNSECTLGPKKTTENLDGINRSQDLPDAN